MSDKPPALNPDGDKPAYKVKIFNTPGSIPLEDSVKKVLEKTFQNSPDIVIEIQIHNQATPDLDQNLQ